MRLSRLIQSCLLFAPLTCAPASSGYPPPCGPGVTRADCHPGKLAPLLCEPDQWLAESLRRSQGALTVCPADSSTYLARTNGQTAPTPDALERFWRRADFFSIPGLVSVRLGSRCGSTQTAGLGIELLRCRTAPDQAVQRIQALAARDPELGDRSVALSLTVLGILRPRCAADELCPPLPYKADEAPAFDPNGTRYVFPDPPERLFEGECAHDGDCFVTGCGNHCSSWLWRNDAGTCEGRPRLYESFCGCVDTRCRWFEQ